MPFILLIYKVLICWYRLVTISIWELDSLSEEAVSWVILVVSQCFNTCQKSKKGFFFFNSTHTPSGLTREKYNHNLG